MRPQAVGRSVRRVEDARLLRGAGRFVDDVDRPGQLWVRVVRASSAHARLTGVEESPDPDVPFAVVERESTAGDR